jgi:hypothetical protein
MSGAILWQVGSESMQNTTSTGVAQARLIVLLLQCRPVAARRAEPSASGRADRRRLGVSPGEIAEERAAERADEGALGDVLPIVIAGGIERDTLRMARIATVIGADPLLLRRASFNDQRAGRYRGDDAAATSPEGRLHSASLLAFLTQSCL